MWTKVSVLEATCCLILSMSAPVYSACGYEACPPLKPGMLNVHLIPHTHDDVGWLKTVEQYYDGSKPEIQKAAVRTIINSMLSELDLDPNRRFIWVETAYLWRWWQESDQASKTKVIDMVNSGQLEIISGGWSMNDEAVTHYQAVIDQMAWGFRKLEEMVGPCSRPRVGWQIDPFGHSRETASLLSQLGFDGLFLGRIDFEDKNRRMTAKEAELIWKASDNLGSAAELFTNVMFNQYSPPQGFCFDTLCHDPEIIDDDSNIFYNVIERVDTFLERVNEQAMSYQTNNILMTMGMDFHFMNATKWYTNLDKLIKHTNARQETEGSKVNLLYSTPSCYLKAVNQANLTWTTKSDDFLPYGSDAHTYWTGFYTSRPALKLFERKGNQLLQISKQVLALAGDGDTKGLHDLRSAMGVMQHHDGVTGTEKQHVAEDYALMLDQAMDKATLDVSNVLNRLMALNTAAPILSLERCPLANISRCHVTENNHTFIVTVYNPLARVSSQIVRLPVPYGRVMYTVLDNAGIEVQHQVVPLPSSLLVVPGRGDVNSQDLVFRAANLPALGFRSYFVHKLMQEEEMTSTPAAGEDAFTIANEKVHVDLDSNTGLISSVTTGGVKRSLKQEFAYYHGFDGHNYGAEFRASGAYIFRPQIDGDPAEVADTATVVTYKGPLVEEIHQVFSPWLSQVIRVYKGDDEHFELEWLVGPLPIDDGIGKEVITRFTTDINSEDKFYTDSNGRETMERVRDHRDTWQVDLKEHVSGNYYPVTASISLTDQSNLLTVLPDRAQGGSSLKSGQLELMVHRRLLRDDAFGVGEALNEQEFGEGLVVRGRHIVLLGESSAVIAKQRQLAQSHMNMPSMFLVSPVMMSAANWIQTYQNEWSGMQSSLPENVHMLTLEPWGATNKLLIRLEHFFENQEHPELSNSATVNLQELFSSLTVISAEERTLGGNLPVSALNERMTWISNVSRPQNKVLASDFVVSLNPMQIRTFLLEVEHSGSVTPVPPEPIRGGLRSISTTLRYNVHQEP